MYKALIIDTETTSAKDPEVIELAWMEPGGVPSSLRFRPSKPSEFGALSVHNILPSELEACPPSDTAPLMLPEAEYLIGHNIDFDWNALGNPSGRRICTQALAREYYPELDSHRLVSCIYYILGPTPSTRDLVRNAHGAAADVKMCEILLRALKNKTSADTWEVLWGLSEEARIPKIMPFGKYSGQPISAVDRGYMNWYRKQADPDHYILEAFKRNGM